MNAAARPPTPQVHDVDIPASCGLTGLYQRVDLADSYAIALPPGTVHDPERLAHCIFDNPASWIVALMKTRDFVVARFGLKTAGELMSGPATTHRIGLFKVYFSGADEIVLGEDDRHLDFRLSILLQVSTGPEQGATLFLSTAVHCHNRLGHVYLAVIAPFHRLISRAVLRRAARIGWPTGTPQRDDGPQAAAA